jgi:hypothetical protein
MPIVVRAAGLLAGLAVAAALVTAWRVPEGDGRVGASVRLTASARGELAVTPTGVLATEPDLRPGDEVSGSVEVRNITALPLTVRVRALPSTPDLGDKVDLDVSASSLTLAPGEARTVRATASMAPGTEDYAGRAADVALTFDVETTGAGN